MRYIKHHLDSINGVDIYPTISLIIFFIFFVVLIWFVMRTDKGFIKKMKNMPLNDDFEKSNESPNH